MKRRHLVQGLLGMPLLSSVPAAIAQAQPSPDRLLIDTLIKTPRDKLQPWVVQEIRAGRLRKPELIKALLSAGVSQIEPRPVGFKYHAVMMVDAARRLSLQANGAASWIPLLWNLDYFKHSQARSKALGGWTLAQASEELPTLSRAPELFHDNMLAKRWARADKAITQLARSGSMHQVFEALLTWAIRDFHSIGHKAILLAGVWRCLEYAGWRNSETILRGMSFALLADGNVAADQQDGWWTQDYALNKAQISKIPDTAFLPHTTDQLDGRTIELLNSLRQESPDTCRQLAVNQLADGMPLQNLWDAVFLAASDAVMNRPTIPMLHMVTVSHGFYNLWQRTADPSMRRLIPLQAVSYVVQMKTQRREGPWNGLDVLDLQQAASAKTQTSNPSYEALGETLGFAPDDARELILNIPLAQDWWALKHQLNRWLLYKSNKAHDFKFGAAVLESVEWLSPQWRTPYLAACSRLLMGSEMPDSVEGDQIQRWLGDAF